MACVALLLVGINAVRGQRVRYSKWQQRIEVTGVRMFRSAAVQIWANTGVIFMKQYENEMRLWKLAYNYSASVARAE